MKDPGGSTYVRWGRTTCPETSELVYDGYAGGGNYGETGSGTNYLCLPKDPEWTQEQSTPNYGYIYGAEYVTPGSILGALQDHDVPCAVCHSNSTNVLMVPAKQTCHTGWIREYTGYLMGEYYGHPASKEYITTYAWTVTPRLFKEHMQISWELCFTSKKQNVVRFLANSTKKDGI